MRVDHLTKAGPESVPARREKRIGSDESESRQEWQREKRALEEEIGRQRHQLEAANKELEDFAYSVSHDLRAPLRAIEGFSRILVEDYSAQLEADAKRYLEIVVASAGKMQRLIDDLLTFSRLNRAPLERVLVPMDEMVRGLAKECAEKESGRHVDVTVSEMLPAWADPVLLRQAMAQLIENAFKFTRRRTDARIEIGSESSDGETIYYVRDNGVGLEMAYAHKLFGVFQKLHPAEEFEGSGIGLAIVQRIIHRHHGRVWVKAATDAGATFYVALPVRPSGAV